MVRLVGAVDGNADIVGLFLRQKSLKNPKYLSYACFMRSIEEITADIAMLKPAEVRKIAEWLAEYESQLWDRRLEENAAAGMLERFINEALEQYTRGETRPL
jgi:hypothetical protein